jgi:Ca2+-transporting ATPase
MKKETLMGLKNAEARQRLVQYGKNIIDSKSISSLRSIFFSQFPTFINGILFVAAVLSFFIENVLDGMLIMAIIVLNGILGFIQEYRAQRSMERLKDYTAPTARVIREGREQALLAENLVPGDVVILNEGSRVPADGSLVEASHLEVDESILTGESLAVMKSVNDSVCLGTLVTRGKGHFMVKKIGMQTRFGQIAGTLSTIQSDKTPLQKNLEQLGKLLSVSVIIIGFLIVPIGLYHGELLLPLILVAASIGIAAIPEGLPTVVTIAFAMGAHQMAARGAIVRKMAAIETLGAVQVILTDKTGTITQNIMRVKKHWLREPDKLFMLLHACTLGNTASLIEKGNGKEYEVVGDQTDGALLMFAKEARMDLDSPHPCQAGGLLRPPLRGNDRSENPDGEVLDEYVFDPKYKTITTLWRGKRGKYVFVRGAPEAILNKSILTEAEKQSVKRKYEEMANEGLRIIAFAYKPETHEGKLSREEMEYNLHFLGYVGIYDPPRIEAKEAIRKARMAGIHVAMVTGDNERTALSLAREIGLIEKDENVVTGAELAKMSDEELSGIILKTRVFARTQPEEKLRLVTILKNQGVVVGVTGDGVNDALALKRGDVGIAMGQGGTDVAKEAADIVLTDDNFATLIKAIEEGRIIYKNICNAVVYLISTNLSEISLVFFASLFHLPFVLLPTQILWINLVTDSLPALALATGARDASVLSQKPRDPQTPLLTLNRLVVICLIGFSLAGFLLTLFAIIIHTGTEAQARGTIFNLLVYFHLLIAMWIGRRSLKRGNGFLVFTVLLIFFLQIIVSTIPFFQQIFHLVE